MPKVSQVGNKNLIIISKPEMAGLTSGITKMKPSLVDGGSACITMVPSSLIRVEASISDLISPANVTCRYYGIVTAILPNCEPGGETVSKRLIGDGPRAKRSSGSLVGT